MKNTRVLCAKSALDQPSAENDLVFKTVLGNADFYYRSQCPKPNASAIIDFIDGKTSEIDNLHMSFSPVHCSVTGQSGSEESMILSISASKNGKTVSLLNMHEKVHTVETLQVTVNSLATALIRRVLEEFDWIEEYEIDLSKFNFIGLFSFMELKPNTQTYEEFVQTDYVLPILPAIPEDYIKGNHIAMLRCGNRSLQISCFAGCIKILLNF